MKSCALWAVLLPLLRMTLFWSLRQLQWLQPPVRLRWQWLALLAVRPFGAQLAALLLAPLVALLVLPLVPSWLLLRSRITLMLRALSKILIRLLAIPVLLGLLPLLITLQILTVALMGVLVLLVHMSELLRLATILFPNMALLLQAIKWALFM